MRNLERNDAGFTKTGGKTIGSNFDDRHPRPPGHCCPVYFVDNVHDIDFTVNWTCESVWDTGAGNIMKHHSNVFHGLLKQIPWERFNGLVRDH